MSEQDSEDSSSSDDSDDNLSTKRSLKRETNAILEQDSKDSSSSDNCDDNVSPRVLLKRVDHHNCRCNTLTQFLINDDIKDSNLMEIES